MCTVVEKVCDRPAVRTAYQLRCINLYPDDGWPVCEYSCFANYKYNESGKPVKLRHHAVGRRPDLKRGVTVTEGVFHLIPTLAMAEHLKRTRDRGAHPEARRRFNVVEVRARVLATGVTQMCSKDFNGKPSLLAVSIVDMRSVREIQAMFAAARRRPKTARAANPPSLEDPIQCDNCGLIVERLSPEGEVLSECPRCGALMHDRGD